MASSAEEKGKKKWQPKRADWKAGSADDGSDDLRGQRMAEVEALTSEGRARKEAEIKVWYNLLQTHLNLRHQSGHHHS